MTKLSYIQYLKENPPKTYIAIILGVQKEKTIALLAESIPQNENLIYRKAMGQLQLLPTQQIINWIKLNMPTSYNKALRSFQTEKIKVIKTYQIK